MSINCSNLKERAVVLVPKYAQNVKLVNVSEGILKTFNGMSKFKWTRLYRVLQIHKHKASLTCSLLILMGSLKTIQVTLSSSGGVVSEPS